jgi:hypothetical protein
MELSELKPDDCIRLLGDDWVLLERFGPGYFRPFVYDLNKSVKVVDVTDHEVTVQTPNGKRSILLKTNHGIKFKLILRPIEQHNQ